MRPWYGTQSWCVIYKAWKDAITVLTEFRAVLRFVWDILAVWRFLIPLPPPYDSISYVSVAPQNYEGCISYRFFSYQDWSNVRSRKYSTDGGMFIYIYICMSSIKNLQYNILTTLLTKYSTIPLIEYYEEQGIIPGEALSPNMYGCVPFEVLWFLPCLGAFFSI